MNKAVEYFNMLGMNDRVKIFDTPTATVSQAAEALGTEEARIGKSLSFLVNDTPIIIVMAGDVKTDNSKYKAVFEKKASMIPFSDVERIIGHMVGGVCPFEINDGVEVYLDESLKRFETVFLACGSNCATVELSIPELERYSGYIRWIDVSKSI